MKDVMVLKEEALIPYDLCRSYFISYFGVTMYCSTAIGAPWVQPSLRNQIDIELINAVDKS